MNNIEKVIDYLVKHKEISKKISEEKLQVKNLVQIIFVLRNRNFKIFSKYDRGKKSPIYYLMRDPPI